MRIGRQQVFMAVVVSGLVIGVGSGCAARHAASAFVRVTTNPLAVHQCQFVGNVKAVSLWSGAAVGLGIGQVERSMQRQAAELGADTVYVGQAVINPSMVHERGEAYRCGGRVERS